MPTTNDDPRTALDALRCIARREAHRSRRFGVTALALVLVLLTGPVAAATGSAPVRATSPVATGADPAVAKAVAEAAATLSEPASAGTSADARGRTSERLATSQRRCSLPESAATVAIIATCVGGGPCSTAPGSSGSLGSPGSRSTLPSCYILKPNP